MKSAFQTRYFQSQPDLFALIRNICTRTYVKGEVSFQSWHFIMHACLSTLQLVVISLEAAGWAEEQKWVTSSRSLQVPTLARVASPILHPSHVGLSCFRNPTAKCLFFPFKATLDYTGAEFLVNSLHSLLHQNHQMISYHPQILVQTSAYEAKLLRIKHSTFKYFSKKIEPLSLFQKMKMFT